jgi:anti-repressor protein
LGLDDVNKATERLDEDEKLIRKIFVSGQNRDMITINESGLYALVLRSNKPEARRFRKWVTSEVLPAINRHGVYMTPQKIEEALLNPDMIIRLATELKSERTKVRALEAKVEADHSKVLFADCVAASHSSTTVNGLAKTISQNGVPIGQKKLFKWLRKRKYLGSKGHNYNQPAQEYMGKLFEVRENATINPDGSVTTRRTPLITGTGQIYFVNKILNEKSRELSSASGNPQLALPLDAGKAG